MWLAPAALARLLEAMSALRCGFLGMAAQGLSHRDDVRPVAWIGGCVLYDRQALVECGGFDFWVDVPPAHAGEDMAAQLRIMERFGGAGVLPSLAFHLELVTTAPTRDAECYDYVIAPLGAMQSRRRSDDWLA